MPVPLMGYSMASTFPDIPPWNRDGDPIAYVINADWCIRTFFYLVNSEYEKTWNILHKNVRRWYSI
jgi:hypothetical protein